MDELISKTALLKHLRKERDEYFRAHFNQDPATGTFEASDPKVEYLSDLEERIDFIEQFPAAEPGLATLEARVALLKECHDVSNDALRSAMQVAQREGSATNWAGHREQLRHALEVHHAAAPSLPSAADIMAKFDTAIEAIKRA
jgi:hypothetical protein